MADGIPMAEIIIRRWSGRLQCFIVLSDEQGIFDGLDGIHSRAGERAKVNVMGERVGGDRIAADERWLTSRMGDGMAMDDESAEDGEDG
jgi:hypothetical protein